ncbi:MAG: polyamine aminopropyltransferase [Fimbriimonadaceae bacterium]|nr:polyamine aminopropyltransferase [Fimbriimonadaceae bacterium]
MNTCDRYVTMPIRSDKLTVTMKVHKVVHQLQTDYQELTILDTEVFGRALLLDGHIQLTEFDERAYHECLVQIPLLSLIEPRSALIIGGGDGGVLREIARHGSIERIDMVEIDAGVIDACREHLPFLNAGAFDDPRLNLTIGDAFSYVMAATGAYDLIVVDATDRYEDETGALSENLFSKAFYADLLRLLTDGGFVVSQADNNVICPEMTQAALSEFAAVYPRSGFYQGLVPSFGGYSGFIWGAKSGEPSRAFDAARARELGLVHLSEGVLALAFDPPRFGRSG